MTGTARSQSQSLDIDKFTYELPPELIAQTPAEKRDQSRLLVLDRKTGQILHKNFRYITNLIAPPDVLVVNDTRVIPARLFARRKTGGRIKFLLLKPEARNTAIWEAMVTPIKRLKKGDELELECSFASHKLKVVDFRLAADGFKRVLVDLGDAASVYKLLNQAGFAPLPPYIQRKNDSADENDEANQTEPPELRTSDLERYQTIFARAPGAVAAPTAGLHFSAGLMDELSQMGVGVHPITLHVGPGTFKPIASSVEEHTIEEERFSISPETALAINNARAAGGRVFAVGTTSLRALETAGASGTIQPVEDSTTDLYVKPGHEFKIVDCLITNFHLSRSSLLVLVCAFAGRDAVMKAYETAVKERYRFYSYGDAMVIV